MDHYHIERKNKNLYVFNTDGGTEYHFILDQSEIVYETGSGDLKNIPEVKLAYKNYSGEKDYKTIHTIVYFVRELMEYFDAFFMQTHNQVESVNSRKIRRGLTRTKLWNRLTEIYFKEYILLTTSVAPNNKNDIPSIFVKKDSAHFKTIVSQFYRYSYLEF